VLAKLNRLLVEDFPAGRFVTMVYAVLDPAQRTLTFANAGHLRPLLMTGSSAQFLDVEQGIPLGLGSGDFSEVEVKLPHGFSLGVLQRRHYRGGKSSRTKSTDWCVFRTFFANRRFRRESAG
jgi:hypothetical protein